MVEVVHVSIRTDPCAHGTDIETEEATADGAKGGQYYVNLAISTPMKLMA
jgi:hypothetical protein